MVVIVVVLVVVFVVSVMVVVVVVVVVVLMIVVVDKTVVVGMASVIVIVEVQKIGCKCMEVFGWLPLPIIPQLVVMVVMVMMLHCQESAAQALHDSVATQPDHGTCRPNGARSGQNLSSSGVVGQ